MKETEHKVRNILLSAEPEFRLMVSCVFRQNPEEVACLCRNGVNWKRLREIAAKHGLDGFLYAPLSLHCPELVPSDELDRLKHVRKRIARANLLLQGELVRISKLFQTEGIASFPLKGPLLAVQLYGNLNERRIGDIDLLVDSNRIVDANRLLNQLGYFSKVEVAPELMRLYVEKEHHYKYYGENNIVVELHWSLDDNRHALPLNVLRFANGTESVGLSGNNFPVLPKEDLLLYLCYHGSKHLWEQLKWVEDVRRLAFSEGIDWEEARQRALQSGNMRSLVLGVLFAAVLSENPLPPFIQEQLGEDSRLDSLAMTVVRHLASDSPLTLQEQSDNSVRLKWEIYRYIFNLNSGIRYKTENLLLMLRPSYYDFISVRLPDSLSFLHYLLRPVRIFSRYVLKKPRER